MSLELSNNSKIKSKTLKNLLINHLSILLIFSIIALIIFPVFSIIFDPTVLPVTGKDGYYRLSNLWHYQHFILDLGKLPFEEGYVGGSPYNALVGIPFQLFLNSVDTFKILVFSSIVLNGYCLFHLAKYLTKNYPASILGGVIFAFSSFVSLHLWAHEWLITLYWVPVFFLFLLKMKDTNKIKYSVIVGISFSLIFL